MRQYPSVGRRDLLIGATAWLGSLICSSAPGRSAVRSDIKAIAFDAFPIFDPRPISKQSEIASPRHGADLVRIWRERQFEYSWLRALSGRYVDFWAVTEDALDFADRSLALKLSEAARAELMAAYLKLEAWPDVSDALAKLRNSGFKLALLSNFSPKMLKSNLSHAKLTESFDHALSTDVVKTYKPDPRAYQIGVDALGVSREEILLVPFTGWDAAGAKAFGYPTFWINRLNLPPEQLGETPDGIGKNLGDLLSFLGI